MTTINIRAPWHADPLGDPTSTSKMDVRSVFFCPVHNGCLLRADIYHKNGKPHCRKHGIEVSDQTNSPLGKAYRAIVHPKPPNGGKHS